MGTLSNLERGNKKIKNRKKSDEYSKKLAKYFNLPLEIKQIEKNYTTWKKIDRKERADRAIKYAHLGGKATARKLSSLERVARAKSAGLSAKLKKAGIHGKRHLWMQWFKEGLKKSGKRTCKGPKNETMVNQLEKDVAYFLFSQKLEYEYEPLIKIDKKIFYPDFVVHKNIIECCYWESEDRWIYLSGKFQKFHKLGYNCILVSKPCCKKYFKLLPNFVKIILEENLKDIDACFLPNGCQPPCW